MRTQYVLGYRPEDAPRDGKWHKVSVKLRLPRKLAFLQAHAKKGYYAHNSEPVALGRPLDTVLDRGTEK